MSFKGIAARLIKIRQGWYQRQLLQIAILARTAAPDNPDIRCWHALLKNHPAGNRRITTALFCLRNGRRRRADTAILVLSALMGWV